VIASVRERLAKSAPGRLFGAGLTCGSSVCRYRVGDEFYRVLDINFSQRGRNIGIYLCYPIFNAIVTILGTRFLTFRYSKR
jgi:ATP-binding cassette subfamily G (WHITE) protein 2 (SNQ2)